MDGIEQRLYEGAPEKQKYPAPERYQDHLLEQYKLYVQMADNISQRRLVANAFFLTLNTVLVSMIGLGKKDANAVPDALWVIIVGLSGIVLCLTWHRLIASYRGLNTGKFKVIHTIEQSLPIRPFHAEWEALGHGQDSSRYQPFTHVEPAIPIVFGALYLVFPIVVIVRACNGG